MIAKVENEFYAIRMDHTGRGIRVNEIPVSSLDCAKQVVATRRTLDNPNSSVNPRPVYWISYREVGSGGGWVTLYV